MMTPHAPQPSPAPGTPSQIPARYPVMIGPDVVEQLDRAFPALFSATEGAIAYMQDDQSGSSLWLIMSIRHARTTMYSILEQARLLNMASAGVSVQTTEILIEIEIEKDDSDSTEAEQE